MEGKSEYALSGGGHSLVNHLPWVTPYNVLLCQRQIYWCDMWHPMTALTNISSEHKPTSFNEYEVAFRPTAMLPPSLNLFHFPSPFVSLPSSSPLLSLPFLLHSLLSSSTPSPLLFTGGLRLGFAIHLIYQSLVSFITMVTRCALTRIQFSPNKAEAVKCKWENVSMNAFCNP